MNQNEKARPADSLLKNSETQRQLANLETARSGYHAWLYLRNLRGRDVHLDGRTPEQVIDSISTAFNSLTPSQTKENLLRLTAAIKPENVRKKIEPWLEQILDQVHLYSDPNVSINNLQRAFENLMDLNLTALTVHPTPEAQRRGEVVKNVPYKDMLTVLNAVEKVMQVFRLKRGEAEKREYKQQIEGLIQRLPQGFDVIVYAEAMQAYWPNLTQVPKDGLLLKDPGFYTRYQTLVTHRAKAAAS